MVRGRCDVPFHVPFQTADVRNDPAPCGPRKARDMSDKALEIKGWEPVASGLATLAATVAAMVQVNSPFENLAARFVASSEKTPDWIKTLLDLPIVWWLAMLLLGGLLCLLGRPAPRQTVGSPRPAARARGHAAGALRFAAGADRRDHGRLLRSQHGRVAPIPRSLATVATETRRGTRTRIAHAYI